MNARTDYTLLASLGRDLLPVSPLKEEAETRDNSYSRERRGAEILPFAPRGYPLRLCVMKPPSLSGNDE